MLAFFPLTPASSGRDSSLLYVRHAFHGLSSYSVAPSTALAAAVVSTARLSNKVEVKAGGRQVGRAARPAVRRQSHTRHFKIQQQQQYSY